MSPRGERVENRGRRVAFAFLDIITEKFNYNQYQCILVMLLQDGISITYQSQNPGDGSLEVDFELFHLLDTKQEEVGNSISEYLQNSLGDGVDIFLKNSSIETNGNGWNEGGFEYLGKHTRRNEGEYSVIYQ